MYQSHPTQYVEEVDAQIDEKLVDLIRLFNTPDQKFYAPTAYCCQSDDMTTDENLYKGYIMFTELLDDDHPIVETLNEHFVMVQEFTQSTNGEGLKLVHKNKSLGKIAFDHSFHPYYGDITTIRWMASGMCNLLINAFCNPLLETENPHAS